MAKTYAYSKAESDAKNQETFNEIKRTTDAISAGEGGKAYATLAEAQAVIPKPVNGTVFQVEESANAGYHKFDSTQTGGTRFVRSFSPTNDQLGINVITPKNFLKTASETPVTDTTYWGAGFLASSGNVSSGTGWYYTKQFIEAYPGTYDAYIRYYGNARLICYDSNYDLIEALPNPTGTSTYSFAITFPERTRWIKISYNSTDVSMLYLTNQVTFRIPTNDKLLASPDFVKNEDVKVKEEVGLKKIAPKTNFIQELQNSDVSNTTLWGSGFLDKTSGKPFAYSGWYYSKKYYRIVPGDYEMNLIFTGNGAVVFYDKDYDIVSTFPNNTGSYYFASVTIPVNAEFVRVSTNNTNTSTMYLRNWNPLTLKESQFISTSGIKKSEVPVNGNGVINIISRIFKDRHIPKPKIPMVSFISDDGHIANDEWYVPALDAKGVRSTFAIITGSFDKPDFYSKQRVIELASLGHDMAGHTQTHQQTGTLTLPEQEVEIQRCKLELEALGVNSDMFVAPYASRTLDTDRIIRKYFKTDFISVADSEVTAGTCVNLPPVKSYLLKRVKFDAEANGVSRLQLCKDAVDVALATGGWLVFAIHPQYGEYSATSNPDGYAARRQELSDLIDYIRLQNIAIITAQQAYNMYKNPVELGNIDLDDKYYALGMDGTESGNYFE